MTHQRVVYLCDHCGKPMHRTPKDAARWAHLYCCRACADACTEPSLEEIARLAAEVRAESNARLCALPDCGETHCEACGVSVDKTSPDQTLCDDCRGDACAWGGGISRGTWRRRTRLEDDCDDE